MEEEEMMVVVVENDVKKMESKIIQEWNLVKQVDKHMHILRWEKISTLIDPTLNLHKFQNLFIIIVAFCC